MGRQIVPCGGAWLRSGIATDSATGAADQRLKTRSWAEACGSDQSQHEQLIPSINHATLAGPQTGDRQVDLAAPHTTSQTQQHLKHITRLGILH